MCKFLITFAIIAILSLRAAPYSLENSHTRLTVDSDHGFAITELTEKSTGTQFIDASKLSDKPPLWSFTMRLPDGNLETFNAQTPCRSVRAVLTDQLTITWEGIQGKTVKGDLGFEVQTTLRKDGATSWKCKVYGNTNAVLWNVMFPCVAGIAQQEDDFVAMPHYLGRLFRKPADFQKIKALNYPQAGSMQFMAYWGVKQNRSLSPYDSDPGWEADYSDAAGILYHIEDPEGYQKVMYMNAAAAANAIALSQSLMPPIPEWPLTPGAMYRCDFTMPYPVVVRPFKGDLYTAAAIYRQWAMHQKWCSAGIIPDDDSIPSGPDGLSHYKPAWFKRASFWTKFYQEPYKVLREWDAMQSWLRVPSPAHYYRYNMAIFDDNYPEHFPGKPYLLNGMRAAKRMHVCPQPYCNGVIWDTDTQSWFKEHGLDAAVRNSDGGLSLWNIHSDCFTHMCPATRQWQLKMQEIPRKQIWEHEMSGVYLDCLAATNSKPCFNPGHGHSLGGGAYHAAGNRKLLHDQRLEIRKFNPDATFFTEEIGELYLDCLDGFLTLDSQRASHGKNESVYPIFNIVYNQYALNFGCDQDLGTTTEAFHTVMGYLLAWGSVPLLSKGQATLPKPGEPNSELLRNMVQGYHAYGQELTFNAEKLRVSQRPLGSSLPKSDIDVQSAPHQSTYSVLKNMRKWAGPAVVTGAFRKQNTVTLLMTNTTTADQTVVITFSDKLFDGRPARTIHQLWPVRKDLTALNPLTLTLSKSTIAIVTCDLQGNAPFPQPRPLLEKDWELISCTQDGPFPASLLDNGQLKACDNAIVQCMFAENNSARLMAYTSQGELQPRRAFIPPGIGAAYEAQSLPRPADGQPFALLHDLPFKLENVRGTVNVLKGDSNYLSLIFTCKAQDAPHLVTQSQGIFTYRVQAQGTTAVGIFANAAQLNQALKTAAGSLPAGTSATIVIGYAALDEATATNADRIGANMGIPVKDFARNWREARTNLVNQSLIDLSMELRKLADSSSACVAMFTPQGPGYSAICQISSLLLPLCGDSTRELAIMLPQDDWLAPGMRKEISLLRTAGSNCEITAIGNRKTAPDIMPGKDSFAITIKDFSYIERLVPVISWTNAGSFVYPSIIWLECNRPYELQTQAPPVSILNQSKGVAKVKLRNWSPLPLTIHVNATANTEGITIIQPPPITAPPLEYTTVSIPLKTSPSLYGGEYELDITANHLSDQEAATVGTIKVNVMERLAAVADSKAIVPHETIPRLRGNASYAIVAKAGDTIRFQIENRRITIYSNDLTWELKSPELAVLKKGTVKVDETANLEITAKQDGAYILECHPNSGSSVVSSSTHPVSEGARMTIDYHLFVDTVTRYFYVNESQKPFCIRVQDGGADEPADIRITSPAGRVVLDRGGNWNNYRQSFNVLPDEAGRIWKVEMKAVQDVNLALGGSATPWLAPQKETVIRGIK